MSRTHLACLALAIAAFVSSPAYSEEGLDHTFYVTWADENCEDFTYPDDLLAHAHMTIAQTSDADLAPLRAEAEAALTVLFEGDLAEYCDTVFFLIENPEAFEE